MGALTNTINQQGIIGNLRYKVLDILPSNSYSTGGETGLAASNLGWDSVSLVQFDQPAGYTVAYDYTNGYVQFYTQGAGLIVEESVTVASNTGRLAYPPAYISSIRVTAGVVTGVFTVIPTGETPLTTQCAVTFTNGTLTFLTGDAVTTVLVTYFPQRNGTMFATSNLIIDELVVASASKTNLANRACLVQYVWDNTDNILNVPEPPGEQPTATHNCVLDINDSGNSSIDSHADDVPNSLKVTYLRYSALPDTSMFIDDADVTLVSQVYEFTGDGAARSNYNALIVPGFGVNLVGEETATNAVAIIGGPGATAANNVARWDPARNRITTAQTGTMTTTAISWVAVPYSVLSRSPLAQVPAGTNLSSVTSTNVTTGIRCIVFGH